MSGAEFRRPNLEASWALSTVPMPANSYSSPELTWTKNTLSLSDDSMRHILQLKAYSFTSNRKGT